MVAPNRQQDIKPIPLKIVGGNNFGRYGKISREESFNMLVSDSFLVPYAGYKNVLALAPGAEGRGIYSSTVEEFILAVIGSNVYRVEQSSAGVMSSRFIGSIFTNSGDVFIAENNNKQVCITDKSYIYVYDYNSSAALEFDSNNTTAGGTISFAYDNPGYISFQNGRLITALLNSQRWILSKENDATVWAPNSPQTTANSIQALQSKPGYIQAAVPVPGGGNNILIFGTNVAESWQDLGLAKFPYQRNSTFNLDYGCLNASSIAELDNFIVWLSVNEQSGPAISLCSGGNMQKISTDGIDFKLSKLTNPTNCTGFLFRQDGHLIYQFTFVDDNLTYAYDFTSKLFFTITDENLNYHPARQVVFFKHEYYFVSLKDGNLYRFGTQYTNADYSDDLLHDIPRIRVTPPFRLPSQRWFIGKSVGFTIENGQPNPYTTVSYIVGAEGATLATESGTLIATEGGTLIDADDDTTTAYSYSIAQNNVSLSISRDGGETFSSSSAIEMNPTGKRKSRLIWQRLGIVNDMTCQFRFNGLQRFVCTEGELEVFQ